MELGFMLQFVEPWSPLLHLLTHWEGGQGWGPELCSVRREPHSPVTSQVSPWAEALRSVTPFSHKFQLLSPREEQDNLYLTGQIPQQDTTCFSSRFQA